MTGRSAIEKLLAEVVETAERNLGFGESGRNNSGPFIDAIGGEPYGEPAWCALFVNHCYRTAARLTGVELPFNPWRRAGVPEAGAATLARLIQVAGRGFTSPLHARPGDVVLWKRKGGHHIGIVWRGEHDLTQTIEGNVGAFPAKVRRLVHDTHNEDTFVRFCTLRGAQ